MVTEIVRVSITGTLPGGEVWSVNPTYRADSGSSWGPGELNTAVTAINGITLGTGLRGTMNSATAVTGCRVEARDYAGTLNNLAEGLRVTPETGTGGGTLPYQSSIVASLRTPLVSASTRGRLYWPATGLSLTSATLRISTSARNAFVDDMKTYLKAIETALDAASGGNTLLAIWSRKNASSFGVSKVLAGDVVDTQRRRRDAIPESYISIDYPLTP